MDHQNMYGNPVVIPGKGKGTAATVLGIISLLLICLGPVGLIFSIIAVILGSSAKKQSDNTYGKAGFVTGMIGLILSLLVTLVSLAMWFGVMAPQLNRYQDKAHQAADMQVCDMVKTAIEISGWNVQPEGDAESAQFLASYGDGNYYSVREIYASNCPFAEEVKDCLAVYSYDELMEMVKSKDAKDIMFSYDGYDAAVKLAGTDIVVE